MRHESSHQPMRHTILEFRHNFYTSLFFLRPRFESSHPYYISTGISIAILHSSSFYNTIKMSNSRKELQQYLILALFVSLYCPGAVVFQLDAQFSVPASIPFIPQSFAARVSTFRCKALQPLQLVPSRSTSPLTYPGNPGQIFRDALCKGAR